MEDFYCYNDKFGFCLKISGSHRICSQTTFSPHVFLPVFHLEVVEYEVQRIKSYLPFSECATQCLGFHSVVFSFMRENDGENHQGTMGPLGCLPRPLGLS